MKGEYGVYEGLKTAEFRTESNTNATIATMLLKKLIKLFNRACASEFFFVAVSIREQIVYSGPGGLPHRPFTYAVSLHR